MERTGRLAPVVRLNIMFGGIEAGGTKFVCGVGTGPDDLKTHKVETTTPAETLPQVIDFFKQHQVRAIGIASFGPLDLNTGYITSTPKTVWADFNLVGAIKDALPVPVELDTDVNGAVLAEARWGGARGLQDAVYITIGTGIGGGALVGGHVIHGLLHPEMGHLRIPHDPHDPFRGNCSYHGDCFEGLASGPALKARWGKPAHELPRDHPAWLLEAHYIALALTNLAVTLSPRRFLLGGGVMDQEQLLPIIRREFLALLKGYVRHSDILDKDYIGRPQLREKAGVLGALVLAEQAEKGRTLA